MDTLVLHIALVVALALHGMHLLARAEVRRLQRMIDARTRTVVVNITADTSAFRAAMKRAGESLGGTA